MSLLAPPVAARMVVDRLAAKDLAAQLTYREAVRRYPEQLKGYLRPVLFPATPIHQVDGERVPVLELAGEPPARAGVPAVIALVLASVCALVISAWGCGEGLIDAPL